MCLPNYISLSLSVINLYLFFLVECTFLYAILSFSLSLFLRPSLSLKETSFSLGLPYSISNALSLLKCSLLFASLLLSLFLSWRNFGKIQSLVQCKKINTKGSTFKASFSVKVIYPPTWTRSQRSNSSIPFMVSMVPTYCWTGYL